MRKFPISQMISMTLAEGVELGSNILHVDERNAAHLSAWRRGSLLRSGRPEHGHADCAEVDPQKDVQTAGEGLAKP
jgi:hypothetical protein